MLVRRPGHSLKPDVMGPVNAPGLAHRSPVPASTSVIKRTVIRWRLQLSFAQPPTCAASAASAHTDVVPRHRLYTARPPGIARHHPSA